MYGALTAAAPANAAAPINCRRLVGVDELTFSLTIGTLPDVLLRIVSMTA
jgi:hypothetical protein